MNVCQAIATALSAQENCRRVGNEEWNERWSEELSALREALPSGSGFDNGTEIDTYTRKRQFKLLTSYHYMNEHGFYDGWYDYEIIVRPEFDGFSVEVVMGPDYPDPEGDPERGIEDYIGDTFDYALNEEWVWAKH